MISIIVAMDKNQLIGNSNTKNGLPWNNKEDLQHFKNTTLNKTILMGYNTYKAIGRPLPNRHTIVVNFEEFKDERVEVRTSLEEVIKEYKDNNKQLYICGGAYIYKQSLPLADELLISRIKGEYVGDAYFPDFNSYGYVLANTIEYQTFDLQIYKKQ